MSSTSFEPKADRAEEASAGTPHDRDPGPPGRPGRKARRAPWVIALGSALLAAGLATAVTDPFGSGGTAGSPGASTADATGIYTVSRQDLSSQTQVPATIGYVGAYSIVAPSGSSPPDVAQAQLAVTADQQTLSADEQTESDKATADDQAIAAAQSELITDQSILDSDGVSESDDCAGPAASSTACSSLSQKVTGDEMQLTQAQEQFTAAQSNATLDHDQNQAKVQADETKLLGDQDAVASLQATEVSPGTTYTSLPQVGDVIKEDQTLYALSDQPVPLLYGSTPAYRAFYVGMSDGADVGELSADLIALGYGAGLTPSDHYSAATATAVERWQGALGLPVTGQILLGAVVFELGPIRVTSVTPSVGQSVGPSVGGGQTVLSATSTTRQVSIALDPSDQSEVAVGDKVSITLPNNETTPGVISSVGTVATSSSSGGTGGSSASSTGDGGSGSPSPTITVLVNPTDPAATGEWDLASVNVTITTARVTNALVVPVAALRAQPGGRDAVEVVDADGVHHLVVVTPGLFDDDAGLVQVSRTTLSTGQRVVVPNL